MIASRTYLLIEQQRSPLREFRPEQQLLEKMRGQNAAQFAQHHHVRPYRHSKMKTHGSQNSNIALHY
jgi:hypothetical protein